MLNTHRHKIIQSLLTRAGELKRGEYLSQSVDLPKLGSWPKSTHRIDKKSIMAIIAAVTANRPLLIRGEPGVGKSQMARAAASLLERHFISTVIQPRSDYQDLMWSIDHTARLGEAQLQAAFQAPGLAEQGNDINPSDKSQTSDKLLARLDIKNYLSPGPLWWAYDWSGAKDQRCHSEYRPEPEGKYKAAKDGVVLLIDEVDKADMSLSNGLLEVLGNGSFNVPYLGKSVGGDVAPLVIITSNDTRELPKAFIRRCVVHELSLPEELLEYFLSVGKAQFPRLEDSIIRSAAGLIINERNNTSKADQIRTGQAEFVDLLRALSLLTPKQQKDEVHELAEFFYKHGRN